MVIESSFFALVVLLLLRRGAEILAEIVRKLLDLIIREILGPAPLPSHRIDQSCPRLFIEVFRLDSIERMTGRAIAFENVPRRGFRET